MGCHVWKRLKKEKRRDFIEKNIRNKDRKVSILKEIVFFNYYVEHLARYFFQIYPSLTRSRVVICDRYVYDLFVQDILAEKSRVLKLIKFFPKPDFVFYLDAKPEVIYKRKNEFRINEIKMQREKYLELCRQFKIAKINSELSKEYALNQVMAIIWRKIIKKLAT